MQGRRGWKVKIRKLAQAFFSFNYLSFLSFSFLRFSASFSSFKYWSNQSVQLSISGMSALINRSMARIQNKNLPGLGPNVKLRSSELTSRKIIGWRRVQDGDPRRAHRWSSSPWCVCRGFGILRCFSTLVVWWPKTTEHPKHFSVEDNQTT